MVNVVVEGDRVRFEVEGWDKLWAFKSQLEIPLAHIRSASTNPEQARKWILYPQGVGLPGIETRGLFRAGSFYESDGVVFYDVHNPEGAVVIELDHERYQRLVVEVESPLDVIRMLDVAINGRRT